MLTPIKRRLDDLGHVLRAVGRHEQRFSTTVDIDVLWVSENRPEKRADPSATWFTRDDCIEVFAETLCMRALPTTLKAF
jgi:hypothetical protein